MSWHPNTAASGLHWASVQTTVDLTQSTANITWGNESVAAEGGEYRVCFCTSTPLSSLSPFCWHCLPCPKKRNHEEPNERKELRDSWTVKGTDTAESGEPCNSQNPHRFTTDAGTLTIFGPRPAHAPWALQFGGEGNDTATHALVDSAEPEKGHVFL